MATAEIREEGKKYWTIVTRFNKFRDQALMRRVATKDMSELLATTHSEAVKSRIHRWLARNQKQSPSNNGGKGGPPRIA